MKELKQLKSSEVTALREQILEEQNGRCAICNEEITDKTGVSQEEIDKAKEWF